MMEIALLIFERFKVNPGKETTGDASKAKVVTVEELRIRQRPKESV